MYCQKCLCIRVCLDDVTELHLIACDQAATCTVVQALLLL